VRRIALGVGVVIVAACGARTPIFLGAEPDDADATADVPPTRVSDAGPAEAATATPEAGAPEVGASPQCVALLARIDALRPAALACCPACVNTQGNNGQCVQLVQDVCCVAWVDDQAPDAAYEFQDDVLAYRKACKPDCGGQSCYAGFGSCDPATSQCVPML
jgi:hypothetical protein